MGSSISTEEVSTNTVAEKREELINNVKDEIKKEINAEMQREIKNLKEDLHIIRKKAFNNEKEISELRMRLYYWENKEREKEKRSNEIHQKNKIEYEVRKRVRIEEERERMREELIQQKRRRL